MKCSYCKQEIDENHPYVESEWGVEHDECYKEAFTSNKLKAKIFRLKNNVRHKIYKFMFFIRFVSVMKKLDKKLDKKEGKKK